MKMTVKLIRKSKNYDIYSKIDNHCNQKEEKRMQQQPNYSHNQNSNFQNSICDTDSSHMSSQDHIFGDITENLDSVYSHQLMNKNHKQLTNANNDSKNRQIRYTVKREKDMKRKKQKNRGKEFSQEDDQRLLGYILKKGPKFHKFSRYFPGKTTNMLKNRYYKQLRFIWDQVLGNEYSYMNATSEEFTSTVAEESPLFMFDEVIQLKLFPEVEDLLTNFIGTLSQTFNNIQAGFPNENN